MNDQERRTTSVEEALSDLRFLLPRIVKGLKRGTSILPPDLQTTLRGASFTGRHFAALMHIADAGALTVSALSERLNVTLPTASMVVHQLASYGIVERQEDPDDRRRTIIRIDPLQREWVETALAERTAPLRRALLRMEPVDRSVLVNAMRILAEEVESGAAEAELGDCRDDVIG